MSKFNALSLSAKLADILDRYELTGPTEENPATGNTRRIYVLTRRDKPTETRRVVHEIGMDDDFWYVEDVPFYARHKTMYYAEAVKRTVADAICLPVVD